MLFRLASSGSAKGQSGQGAHTMTECVLPPPEASGPAVFLSGG